MVTISMSREDLEKKDTSGFDEYYSECTEGEIDTIMSMMRASLDEYDFDNGRITSCQAEALAEGFRNGFGVDPVSMTPQEIIEKFQYD